MRIERDVSQLLSSIFLAMMTRSSIEPAALLRSALTSCALAKSPRIYVHPSHGTFRNTFALALCSVSLVLGLFQILRLQNSHLNRRCLGNLLRSYAILYMREFEQS